MIAHPHVERRSGVQGGRPVIRGTRFPVSSVVQNYQRGLSVEEMIREFPHLTPAQIDDALSYYFDHREQVDEKIEKLRNIEGVMAAHPPTVRPDETS